VGGRSCSCTCGAAPGAGRTGEKEGLLIGKEINLIFSSRSLKHPSPCVIGSWIPALFLSRRWMLCFPKHIDLRINRDLANSFKHHSIGRSSKEQPPALMIEYAPEVRGRSGN
jgi:hypothetical protein